MKPLTPRLRQVAELILNGYSGPEIARAMGIAEPNARAKVVLLLNHSGMWSRGELLAWLYAHRSELNLQCWWEGDTFGAPKEAWLIEREHIEQLWKLAQPIKFPSPQRRRREDREIPKAA